jgi:hypothetical protein
LVIAPPARLTVMQSFCHRGYCNAHTYETRDADISAPFSLKGVDRRLAAGEYEVATDEELIEGLSFPVYRRVATLIFLPAGAGQQASMEMVTVNPDDLAAAHQRDQA